jgi:hypothetical protein
VGARKGRHRDFEQLVAAGQAPDEQRRVHRFQARLTSETDVERLELLGGPEQERWSVAAPVGGKCDLGSQHIYARSLELVEESELGSGQ